MKQRLCALVLMGLASIAAAADVANGQRLYSVHCVGCHGATGEGVMPNAPKFSRGDGLMRADPDLLQQIKTGRGAMPGYFGILRDAEMFDLIAYLRTLPR